MRVFRPATRYRHKFNLWIDDCNIYGNTKFTEGAIPIDAMHLWYTNSYFTHLGKGVNEAKPARNIRLEQIGDDAIVRSPFVMNIHASDIDPQDGTCTGGGCAHADCFQWWGRPTPIT